MSDTYTACQGCEHFAPNTPLTSWGVCRHKNGPNGKVFTKTFSFMRDGEYEPGCPKNPDPPAPARKRPGMDSRKPKRGPKHTPPEE